MSEEQVTDKKRIAKNTLFLYFRMILVMGVALYTSRVVLDKLGESDFALYNVVGGVVGMLSFLTGTLTIGTSRFITYELGAGDSERLSKTFDTAVITHIALGLVIVVLLLTGGMWFVYNKLEIPAERFDAALIAYYISIATTFVAIFQIPYTSAIMAHERMGVYAYVSIFEAFAKLVIVYLLSHSSFDKLVLYAALVAGVQLVVTFLYWLYCNRHFVETKLKWQFEQSIFKSIMGFSGWNVMANLTETLKLQGVTILYNLFFPLQPFIVAAQAVSNQVTNTMMQFVNNIRAAINPQIIKSYAAGEYEESRRLTLMSATYVFDILLLLGLPLILLIEPILNVWLVKVPEYTVVFVQFAIVTRVIGNFSDAFYIPMMASGKVKSNSLAAVIFGVGQFVILYFLLKSGFGPLTVQYLALLLSSIFAFVIKPLILIREIDYSFKEILVCYFSCFKVAILSCLIILPVFYNWEVNNMLGFIIVLCVSVISVAFSSFVFMERQVKEKIIALIKSKLGR